MGLFYLGLRDTTATYATNFLSLIPIVTFVISAITGYIYNIPISKTHCSNITKLLFNLLVCRVEKLGLHALAGKLKALGAIFCVAGALTTSLYKGKAFHLSHHGLHPTAALETSMPHWGRGTFMLLGSCLSYATWYIVQVCIPLQSIYYIIVTENARDITDFLFTPFTNSRGSSHFTKTSVTTVISVSELILLYI